MRDRKLGVCIFCDKEKPIVAKGLCAPCYGRKQRTGSCELKRKGRSTCSVDGCEKYAVSMGLCDTHRKRVARHGSIDAGRPDDWGDREKHPMYQSWSYLRKTENKDDVCEEWLNDFWIFVKDVGERPSEKHVLVRPDSTKQYQKGNYIWRRNLDWPKDKEGRSKLSAAGAKKWREDDKDREKSGYLRNRYGINIGHYNELLKVQEEVCAICGKPERHTNPNTGKPRKLAVDHDHASGKIRGLLCTFCNTALGKFKDDVALLQKAIDYINLHSS